MSQKRFSHRMTRGALVLVAVPATLALAACSMFGGQPKATTSPTHTPDSSASASPTPSAAPTLLPDAPAADNLTFFNSVAESVIAQDPAAGGRAFIDALVSAGFNKAEMEVGFDRTSVDLAADSVQWAVRFNGECLIGQYGPSSGGYHGIVTPLLSTGTCLIGATRPIDW